MPIPDTSERKRVPIKAGLLADPLTPLEQARLLGSRCGDCGEMGLGAARTCANCGGKDLEMLPLGRKGKLWTYTVIRHKPPGDYKGPDPFVPFGLGLVELPDGLRVLSPIQCDPDQIKIDMDLELEAYPLFTDETGNEVIAFRFRQVQEESR